MGFSKKSQVDGCPELKGKMWVIIGLLIRTSLKPIITRKPIPKEGEGEGEEDVLCSTPKSTESRIPSKLSCPPAPRKRRSLSKCHLHGVREFFTPPDLESVFKLRTERTN